MGDDDTRGRTGRIRPLLVLLAGLLLAQILCLAFSGSLPQRLHTLLWRGDRSSLQLCEGLDGFLDQVAPDGNLFLQYEGFEALADGHRPASLIYFRSVYHLWPRRVYTGPEDRVITRGDNLIGEPAFIPDAAWLRERGVRHWLVFQATPTGAVSWREMPVAADPAPAVDAPLPRDAGRLGPAAVLWTGLYLLAILLLGIGLHDWARGGRAATPSPLLLAEGWMLGMGGAALLAYWLGLAGMPMKRPAILLLLAAGAALFAWRRPWRHGPEAAAAPPLATPSPGERWVAVGAIALILASTVVVGLNALALPVYDVDGFALWGLKGKVLFSAGLTDGYFRQPNLGFSQLDYPLLGPFLAAGMHAAGDTLADTFARLPLALGHLAFAGTLALRLRTWLRPADALALAAILHGAAAMVQWAGGGSMDTLLALFYMASAGSLAAYLTTRDPGDLRTACLCTAFLAFTKNEGMPLALINLAVVAVMVRNSRVDLRRLALVAGGVLLLWLPWGLWARHLPHLHENYPAQLPKLADPEAWRRLPDILADFAGHLPNWRRWGLLWLTVPAAAAAVHAWRRRPSPAAMALLLMGAAHLGLYLVIYIISPWPLDNLAAAATERLLLHLAPLAPLLAAALAAGKTAPEGVSICPFGTPVEPDPQPNGKDIPCSLP